MAGKNAKGFFFGGMAALLGGVLLYLFVNVWVGAFLTLGAELLFMTPRTMVQNAVKKENPGLDKAALRIKIKEAQAAEIAADPMVKFCFVFGIISFIVLIGMVLFGSFIGVM